MYIRVQKIIEVSRQELFRSNNHTTGHNLLGYSIHTYGAYTFVYIHIYLYINEYVMYKHIPAIVYICMYMYVDNLYLAGIFKKILYNVQIYEQYLMWMSLGR